jgi:CHAD domain-containing protein
VTVELLLTDEGSALAAMAALGEHWTVEGAETTVVDREFLDSFDGRLHAAGLVLERPAHGGDHRMVLREPDGLTRTVDGPVRERLQKVLGVRSVQPQARVRSRLRPLRLRNEDSKIVVRVTVETPEVIVPGQEPKALGRRLHLNRVLGYDADLARAQALLEGELGLTAPERSLVDESILLAGGSPDGRSTKIDVKLRARDRADTAAVTVCRQMAEVAEATLPGTLADHDIEFLHDFRVAIRRTRSMLRELEGTLPPEEAGAAAEHLRWVQKITGETRDLDVLLEEWDERLAALPAAAAADLGPVRTALARRRDAAFSAMRAQLRSPRYEIGWRAWRTLLDRPLGTDDPDERPRAATPIAELAGERIRTVYDLMVRHGAKIGADSPAEDLHRLRKRGKELRYLLEVFGGLWPAKEVKPLVKTLKELQDVLGRFQDREAQADDLRDLAGDVADEPGGAEALIALGRLLDALDADQRAAREEFFTQFPAFASKPTRKRVKETFVAKAAKKR